MPINTKAMIADKLHMMMQQKSFDKITVTELVETCNISRQTFYYHFQDILDVVEWSAQQALQKALSQSLKADNPEKSVRFLWIWQWRTVHKSSASSIHNTGSSLKEPFGMA